MSLFLILVPIVAGVVSLAHIGHLYFGVVHNDAWKFVRGLIGITPLPLTIWAYSSFESDMSKGFGLLVIAVMVMFGSMAFYDSPQER